MLFQRCLLVSIFAAVATTTSLAQDQTGSNPSVYGRRSAVSIDRAAVSIDRTPASIDSDQAPIRRNIENSPAPTSSFPALNSLSTGKDEDGANPAAAPDAKFAAPLVTVTSSLAVVLGLFAAMVWITRKYGSKGIGNQAIPKEVLFSLGSTSIDPRTRVSLIRVGGKILVVAQTAGGIEPLSEITDLDEVRRLTAACSGKSKKEFASTIESLERESVDAGFVDGVRPTPASPRRTGSLFATA